jgi:putative phage-type endonuclease
MNEPNYIFDMVQQTEEWYAAKLGMFSGSSFHVFLGNSATKTDKLWELIAERRYQDSDKEDMGSFYTERGNILEPEARRMYSAVYETEVKEVGLVEDREYFPGYVVCSPDGLVGDDGIIEIKCLVAKYMTQYTEGKHATNFYIEPKYRTQVQFNLLVTQRKWCDFIYYHPRVGLRVQRIERDPEYQQKILDTLKECVAFIKENQ